MSKPVFMRLNVAGIQHGVNMSLVTYMSSNNPSEPTSGTVLYFSGGTNDEPVYLIVDEPIDEIANRKEWYQ